MSAEEFVSAWLPQKIHATNENAAIAFPDANGVQGFVRFDLFERDPPLTQIIVSDPRESYRLRNSSEWYLVRSLFLPSSSSPMTKPLAIESADPPKRHRFRPIEKSNVRDLSQWVSEGCMHSLVSLVSGSAEFFIDYADSPDRYLISSDRGGTPGWRRLYRFIAFPVTQYFILRGECGGCSTCLVTAGTSVAVSAAWRLVGSFFALDAPLPATTRYSIYTRQDPFPRILVSTEPSFAPVGWTETEVFYSFDVALAGTTRYIVKAAVPELQSQEGFVSRHVLTTEGFESDWDFRCALFVFPASLADCCLAHH